MGQSRPEQTWMECSGFSEQHTRLGGENLEPFRGPRPGLGRAMRGRGGHELLFSIRLSGAHLCPQPLSSEGTFREMEGRNPLEGTLGSAASSWEVAAWLGQLVREDGEGRKQGQPGTRLLLSVLGLPGAPLGHPCKLRLHSPSLEPGGQQKPDERVPTKASVAQLLCYMFREPYRWQVSDVQAECQALGLAGGMLFGGCSPPFYPPLLGVQCWLLLAVHAEQGRV